MNDSGRRRWGKRRTKAERKKKEKKKKKGGEEEEEEQEEYEKKIKTEKKLWIYGGDHVRNYEFIVVFENYGLSSANVNDI